MSTSMSSFRRSGHEHFEPQTDSDPHAQRRLRGQLEQIDYTAYASNREVVSQTIAGTDAQKFQRLAVAAALARSRWVAAALEATESTQPPSAAQIETLTRLRTAFEELSAVYDAMRRLVERGYLAYSGPAV
jgi:hypothetical protein